MVENILGIGKLLGSVPFRTHVSHMGMSNLSEWEREKSHRMLVTKFSNPQKLNSAVEETAKDLSRVSSAARHSNSLYFFFFNCPEAKV